jgi:hypothetical protein
MTNLLEANGSKVTLPKWVLTALVAGSFAVGGTWAKILVMANQISRLEAKQVAYDVSMQRMEKILCRICVGTLGEPACKGPCE